MKTAAKLLEKAEDLSNSIRYTEKAISLIVSALRNKANHRVHIADDANEPKLILDIDMIAPILISHLDKLKENQKNLLELQKNIMEDGKFELLFVFDPKQIYKDCLACWIDER